MAGFPAVVGSADFVLPKGAGGRQDGPVPAPHPTNARTPPVSCRLELLPGDRVIDQLSAAGRFGFDGVALPGRYLSRWREQLRVCVADSPVALAGISLGFTGSLLSPREAVRQQCRESLCRLFELCAGLGAGWINMPPCLIQDNPERFTGGDEFATVEGRLDALLLEQLPALGDAAHALGVSLLIEPVNRYESEYLNSIVHAARLCTRLDHPAIGCTADFFHMQLEELDTASALGVAAPRVRHLHLAGNTRVEPGTGSLDFRPGFQALKAAGYRGWLEIECRSLSGRADEVLPKSADYLRKKWNEA